MRLALLGVVALLGCSESGDTPIDARVADARVLDATIDAHVPVLGDSGLVNAGDARACPTGDTVMTVDALCALLDADGRITCPRTRADFARAVDCDAFTFPSLRRHCDFDVLESGRAQGLTYSWTFDRTTGALVHASVAGSFACGTARYHTDRPWPTCDRLDETCALCEGGPERDAACPDDVRLALPHPACGPSPISACFCGGGSFSARLPNQGSPCNPVCDACQDGTCWTSCVCSHDGTHRWRLACTE